MSAARFSLAFAFALAVTAGGGEAGERCAADVTVPPERRAAALEAVRTAPDELEARRRTNAMWEIWATAPDAHAQELLDEGMQRREVFDLDGAIKAFDALVAYCPGYAEGYNQRAFALFIRQDYALALEDLDRAIARAPDHFAAIAGRGLTLMGLGRNGEAKTALEEALALNPWLPERGLMSALGVEDI